MRFFLGLCVCVIGFSSLVGVAFGLCNATYTDSVDQCDCWGYFDNDSDGYGAGTSQYPTSYTMATDTNCTSSYCNANAPACVADDLAPNSNDCDDTSSNRNPGLSEVCGDGITTATVMLTRAATLPRQRAVSATSQSMRMLLIQILTSGTPFPMLKVLLLR